MNNIFKLIGAGSAVCALMQPLQAEKGKGFNGLSAGVSGNYTRDVAKVGIDLDFHKTFENALYVGFGGDFKFSLDHAKSTEMKTNNTKVVQDLDRKLEGRLTQRLGIARDQYAVYGLFSVGVGRQNTRFKVGNDSQYNTNTFYTLAPGAGTKYKLSDQISLGLEYRHVFFRGFKKAQHSNCKDKYPEVELKLSYHF